MTCTSRARATLVSSRWLRAPRGRLLANSFCRSVLVQALVFLTSRPLSATPPSRAFLLPESLDEYPPFFTTISTVCRRCHRFPALRQRTAGIYVPSLAYQVVLANKAGANINLKGILVGNGCIGTQAGICGGDNAAEFTINLPFLAGHALIAPSQMTAINAACTDINNPSSACIKLVNQATNAIGNVNIYNILAPCINSGAEEENASAGKNWRRPPTKRELERLALGGPDGCIDGGPLAAYLNQPSVKAALHVAPGINWAVCSNNATFNYNPTEPDERVVIYPTIVGAGIRTIIYNGDVDDCVPWLDNYYWTASMNYTVVNPWHAWSVNNQVAGYAINYANGFTFLTVKGAGRCRCGCELRRLRFSMRRARRPPRRQSHSLWRASLIVVRTRAYMDSD